MNRAPVSSKNIRSIGYSQEQSLLEVEFHHGGIYQYFNVPISMYHGLMEAGSKGSFLAENIKFNYRYQRVA
jgi:hypothetical protein